MTAAGVVKPDSAAARATIKLRAGEHQGFARLVFDWAETTNYRVRIEQGHLILVFPEPARFDVSVLRHDLEDYIDPDSVSQNALGISFRLKRPLDLRHFVLGPKVVIDLIDRPESPPDQVELRSEEPDGSPSEGARAQAPGGHSSNAKEQPAWPDAESHRETSLSGGPDSGNESSSGNNENLATGGSELVQVPDFETLQPLVTMAGPAGQTQPDGTPMTDQQTEIEASAQQVKTSALRLDLDAPLRLLPEDLAGEWQRELERPSGAIATPLPQLPLELPEALKELRNHPSVRIGEGPVAVEAPLDGLPEVVRAADTEALADWNPIPGRNLRPEPPVAMAFNWAAETALAAFRRGSHLWFVFDRPSDPGLADRIAEVIPSMGSVEQLDVAGATVIRISAPIAIGPRAVGEGSSWLIDLRARGLHPETAIEHGLVSSGPGVAFRLAVKQASRVIEVTDPDYGDKLFVVPTKVAGLGLKEEFRLSQFDALASYQGVAIRVIGDDLRVSLKKDGVMVSAAGGLVASRLDPDLEKLRRPAPAILGQRLFDLPGWRIAPDALAKNYKQKLLSAISVANGDDLTRARMDLVRFYFAHGLGIEALAGVEMIENVGSSYARDPELLLIKAASHLLAENYEEARILLADPLLAEEWEALPWHAAIAAIAQDWNFAATAFRQSELLLGDYVRPVEARLRLLAAEARIGIEDSEGADFYLEHVRTNHTSGTDQAQVDYLEAMRRLLEHRVGTAKTLLERVARGPHPASRARARIALIDLEAEDEEPDFATIGLELDRLRFAWRGDAFELALQRRLAEFKHRQGDYRKALSILGSVAKQTTDVIMARQADRRMREIFLSLYQGGATENVSPVLALALYEEFKELVPSGAAGRATVNGLIDRLVGVDLLDRAAALLEDQIRFELSGEEKAEAGEKLAGIRLESDLPHRALDALDGSLTPDLAEPLATRRQFLRARALSKVDQVEDALALLAPNPSESSLRLQCHILWEELDWRRAAGLLERLIPESLDDPSDMSEQQSEDLSRLAVAYTMIGDRAGLIELEQRFGSVMATGPQAETFGLLTRDHIPMEVTTVAEELAGAARIERSLADLRSAP